MKKIKLIFFTAMVPVLLQSFAIANEAGDKRTEDTVISNADSAYEAEAAGIDARETITETPDNAEMYGNPDNSGVSREEDQAADVNQPGQISTEENGKAVADAADEGTQPDVHSQTTTTTPAAVEEKKKAAGDAAPVNESQPAADNAKQQENGIGQENNQETLFQKEPMSYDNLRPVSRDQYRSAPGPN